MTGQHAAAHDLSPSRKPRFAVAFSARDLVNVAIFSVISFVVTMAVATLGIVSPLMMILTLPLCAIVAGIPYMLFLTRVRHAGMVTLFGLVFGVLFMMMGNPWHGLLVTLLVSLIAEAILWSGRYRSKWAAIWAYTVFSLWFIGPWAPVFLDSEGYLQLQGMSQMDADYVAEFARLVTGPVILGMWVATAACGFLGALLGTAMLRKHFQKAGLA